MQHPTEITISRKALEKNLQFIKKLVGEGVTLSSVVKGNAYGHEIETFVPLAESLGIRHFSVFSSDEAFRVQSCARRDIKILIMGFLRLSELEGLVRDGIEFFVFDLVRLKAAVMAAQKVGAKARVHIELETGMNRTGFSAEELPSVAEVLLTNAEFLDFTGLCTHFAGAESIANFVRIEKQKEAFFYMERLLAQKGLTPRMRHTCCSAAAVRYPEMHFDMVRLGIMQYGFWPSREIFIEFINNRRDKQDPLKRCIEWRSTVMTVKHVKMGEFIGYGTNYLANNDMKIAIVPVGYSHGFSRSLSNQGRVLIKGRRLGVIGIVNMNSIAVDITGVPDVQPGDEVMLIGMQQDNEISVSSFSELSVQLNYELLTRLPHDIPRQLAVD